MRLLVILPPLFEPLLVISAREVVLSPGNLHRPSYVVSFSRRKRIRQASPTRAVLDELTTGAADGGKIRRK